MILLEIKNQPMKKDVYSIFDAAMTIWLMAVVLVHVALFTFTGTYLVKVTFMLRHILCTTLTETKNQSMKIDV
jgi:hypothetical protein